MKTLLLSLVVVAFVYLDSGYTIQCYLRSTFKIFQNCPNATACYKKISGGKITRGCAFNCTLPAARETIKYCTEDKCNGLSFK
nr:three-finger toxin [Helicops leopardinus]